MPFRFNVGDIARFESFEGMGYVSILGRVIGENGAGQLILEPLDEVFDRVFNVKGPVTFYRYAHDLAPVDAKDIPTILAAL